MLLDIKNYLTVLQQTMDTIFYVSISNNSLSGPAITNNYSKNDEFPIPPSPYPKGEQYAVKKILVTFCVHNVSMFIYAIAVHCLNQIILALFR